MSSWQSQSEPLWAAFACIAGFAVAAWGIYKAQKQAPKQAHKQSSKAPSALKSAQQPSSKNDTHAPSQSRQRLIGAAWGAGTLAVVWGLWSLAHQGAAQQNPPQNPSSNSNQNQSQATPHPEVQGLLTTLRKTSSDLPALLRLGHILLQQQMLREAEVVTQRALAIDAQNPEARIHQAVLQSAQEDGIAPAQQALAQIAQEHPTLSEVWLFSGMMALRQGQTEQAKKAFAQFVAHAPPGAQRERIGKMLEGL